jgi:DNA-binding MarR family transcriptional regulator
MGRVRMRPLAYLHYFSYIQLSIFLPSENGDLRESEKTVMSKATPGEGTFAEGYLPALLAQASHLISGEFHRIVTRKGFTVSEWRVLASLAGAEQKSIGELARMAVMKQPTLTRVLDRMQSRGLVRRVAHDSDRRITLVAITPAGNRQVADLIELANEHEHRVLEPFGLARSQELKKTLKQMIELHEKLAEDAADADDGEQ